MIETDEKRESEGETSRENEEENERKNKENKTEEKKEEIKEEKKETKGMEDDLICIICQEILHDCVRYCMSISAVHYTPFKLQAVITGS